MSSEDGLRSVLRQHAGTHRPDVDRMRARFDAGVNAELRSRSATSHRAQPAGLAGRGASFDAGRGPARRGKVWAAVVSSVVACVTVSGVAVATHSAAVRPIGPDPAVIVAPPSTPTAGATTPPSATPTATRLPTPNTTTTRSPSSAAQTAPGGAAVAPVTRCGSFDGVSSGPFVVANNLWAASRGTGTQCIRATSGPATPISWSTNWDWSGGPGQVKSFTSVVLGWRWGFPTGPRGGLPVAVSDHRAVRAHWAYSVTQSRAGHVDVAYDMWFHGGPTPGDNEQPAAEMRVLLDETSVPPPGQAIGTSVIAGVPWTLYHSKNNWDVFTFVRTGGTRPVEVNLTDFTDTLSGAGRLSPTLFMTSVQAGADVIDGAGTLTTSAYSVTIG